jgi:poly(glycerol-phosphate) alpha-glucosyltransferase
MLDSVHNPDLYAGKFPEITCLIITGRLRPGLDGGAAISTLQRAELLASAGVPVTILTVDMHPDCQRFYEEFRNSGLLGNQTTIRNFLEEVRNSPDILRRQAQPGLVNQTDYSANLTLDEIELDTKGFAWRQIARDADGQVVFTDFFDSSGIKLFRLPFLKEPDWWRAPVTLDVFGPGSDNKKSFDKIGAFLGFKALYRAWWESVIFEIRSSNPKRPVVAIAEARQVGELFLGLPDVYLVHTVHNAHTLAPHYWDSPMDITWSGWIDTVSKYDAVVWLTERQLEDVDKLLGGRKTFSAVIPHPALIPKEKEAPSKSIKNLGPTKSMRAIMTSRLAPAKRVDHAIRAWEKVIQAVPDAMLDIYGEGPDRNQLQLLINELNLENRVSLHGYIEDAREQARTAVCHILTSRYEGQSLAIAESMARGCPSIAYDISYGPAQMITDGKSGLLVPSGEIDQLAAAVISVFKDKQLARRLSMESLRWAESNGPDRTLWSWKKLLEGMLANPPGMRL